MQFFVEQLRTCCNLLQPAASGNMYSNRENATLMISSRDPTHFSDGSSLSSDDDSCSHGELWESSHSSSCSSCTGSTEWESEILPNGELWFIESDQSHQSKNSVKGSSSSTIARNTLTVKDQPTKSWRNGGKLVRLIRRRESKRHRGNGTKNNDTGTQNSNLSPSSDVPKDTDLNVVKLLVDPWVKPNLGRRATISETLLGLVTTQNASSVIVTDYVPDSLAAKQMLIKRGDKISSINGKPVEWRNFNLILEAINSPTMLYLGINSAPKTTVVKENSSVNNPHKVLFQTPLAQQISRHLAIDNELQNVLIQLSIGMLYLQLDGLSEGGPEDQGVLYCHPGNLKTNVLGPVRGAFLTLFQLVPDICHATPKSSSIVIRNQLIHVVYAQEGRELLLLAVPSSRCSLPEAIKQCTEFVRMLQFTHQSLSRCFSSLENRIAVNHQVSIFLSRLLLSEKWIEITDSSVFGHLECRSLPTIPQFELVLPAAHLVPLPREVQIQIDDALSELESNDIGDNCEDLDCQRLFTILGCCLYHKGYLLASHFTHGDILDVHTFCRQHGLLDLNHSESVKSLVIWKEVFPSSVSRGLESASSDYHSAYSIPGGRWFIMIVGQKQDMLVTLLEAGGCSAGLEGHPSPDVFYVEAAQDTLQHLMKMGVSNVTSEWLDSQVRPKLTSPEAVVASRLSARRVNNLLGIRVSHDPGWQNSFSSILSSPPTKKSTEFLDVGKRKPSPDHSSSGPLHGETSEDSASLVASLPSDDTGFVLGKSRAEHVSHSDLEESDSDWEASDVLLDQRVTSTTDLSDLQNSLLKSVEGTVPSMLNTGPENIVFHYVHIDTTEGILVSPVHSSVSPSLHDILSKFRQSAMQIHTLFQNTISFKKLKGGEASLSLINKSLVAIKEFGALFECHLPARGSEKVAPPLAYWVVGRLFFMPTPREVYVCYEDSAPQNLIELAFRLAITTSG